MRWTLRGAHLLLQTRTNVLNNELEEVFRRRYPQFRAKPMTPRFLTDSLKISVSSSNGQTKKLTRSQFRDARIKAAVCGLSFRIAVLGVDSTVSLIQDAMVPKVLNTAFVRPNHVTFPSKLVVPTPRVGGVFVPVVKGETDATHS